jgi:uncharacterized protein with NRDE domain
MCTVTWWQGSEGYEVFFNRDERLTRPEALPPAVREEDGVKFLAPVDVLSGGTWLLVNEAGVTLAILNHYEKEEPEPPGGVFRSRGQLVWSLASCASLEEVAARLGGMEIEEYNAFLFLAFDPGSGDRPGARVWQWVHEGTALRGPDPSPGMPVCSSSFAPERVVAARRRAFAELVPAGIRASGEAVGPEWLDRYHHLDGDGHPGPETVLMRRPDARTWSISRVRVERTRVAFRYEAVRDIPSPPVTGELERRRRR